MKSILLSIAMLMLFSCYRELKTPEKEFDYSDRVKTEKYDNGIIFYGDSQKHHDIHSKMVSNILALDPKSVFHLGDMVSDGSNNKEWKEFDIITREIRKNTNFYPVIGNHEKGVDPEWYFNHWDISINEGYYIVDYDHFQIIVLHSNPGYFVKGNKQYNWLMDHLNTTSNKPTILVFHIPLYMVGVHHSEIKKHPSSELYNIINSKKYNILGTISGHDRSYQRFYIDNISYIVTGDSGETPNPQKVKHQDLVIFKDVYNFTLLNVRNKRLYFTTFDINMKIIDEFTLPL